MTKRGEPLPINQAMNEIQSKARPGTADVDGYCLFSR